MRLGSYAHLSSGSKRRLDGSCNRWLGIALAYWITAKRSSMNKTRNLPRERRTGKLRQDVEQDSLLHQVESFLVGWMFSLLYHPLILSLVCISLCLMVSLSWR